MLIIILKLIQEEEEENEEEEESFFLIIKKNVYCQQIHKLCSLLVSDTKLGMPFTIPKELIWFEPPNPL